MARWTYFSLAILFFVGCEPFEAEHEQRNETEILLNADSSVNNIIDVGDLPPTDAYLPQDARNQDSNHTDDGDIDLDASTMECHRTGAEQCDGLDNDCDGMVDDGELCGADHACIDGICEATVPLETIDEFIIDDVDWYEAALLPDDDLIRINSRAVGQLRFLFLVEIFYRNAPLRRLMVQRRCTGFLVSQEQVMTNHHCVRPLTSDEAKALYGDDDDDQMSGLVQTSVSARAAFRNEVGVSPEERAEATFNCPDWVFPDAADANLDVVVFTCNARDGRFPGEDYGVVSISAEQVSDDEEIYVIHQNCDWIGDRECDRTKKISPGRVLEAEIDEITLSHNADTLGGSSGAPVFSARTHKLVGLHFAGVGNRNTGRGDFNLARHIDDVLAAINWQCVDHDGDGWGVGPECVGLDCDDHNPNINPGMDEVCNDVDDNCDGAVNENTCSDCESCVNSQCEPVEDGLHCSDDGEVCTQDQCVEGQCRHLVAPNDCEEIVCGPSPSGCHDCGQCPAGLLCAADGRQCVRPAPCDDVECAVCSTCVDGECVPMDDGLACDNETVCDGRESCRQGQCVRGEPLDCFDDRPCTADVCDPVSGCENPANEGCLIDAVCVESGAINADNPCEQCRPRIADRSWSPIAPIAPCVGEACQRLDKRAQCAEPVFVVPAPTRQDPFRTTQSLSPTYSGTHVGFCWDRVCRGVQLMPSLPLGSAGGHVYEMTLGDREVEMFGAFGAGWGSGFPIPNPGCYGRECP